MSDWWVVCVACGNEFTLHFYTVCPKCATWPTRAQVRAAMDLPPLKDAAAQPRPEGAIMSDSTWEIRRIRPASVYKMNFCSEGACCEKATFYLVRLPAKDAFMERESRMRRCEAHARENACSMRLAFPKAGQKEPQE